MITSQLGQSFFVSSDIRIKAGTPRGYTPNQTQRASQAPRAARRRATHITELLAAAVRASRMIAMAVFVCIALMN